MTDYNEYKLRIGEKLTFCLIAAALLFCVGILFYKDLVLSLVCASFSVFLLRPFRAYLIKRRRKKLMMQFKDFLLSVSSSISAGNQMPAAISNAIEELEKIYGENGYMVIELRYISRSYELLRDNIGTLFSDLGRRSDVEEIKQFALSYNCCRESGGNLESVAMLCADMLIEKFAFKEMVAAKSAEKKLDIALLGAMPFLMIILLNISAGDYIGLLYSTMAGKIMMTIALGLMVLAFVWSLRIIDVDF